MVLKAVYRGFIVCGLNLLVFLNAEVQFFQMAFFDVVLLFERINDGCRLSKPAVHAQVGDVDKWVISR